MEVGIRVASFPVTDMQKAVTLGETLLDRDAHDDFDRNRPVEVHLPSAICSSLILFFRG